MTAAEDASGIILLFQIYSELGCFGVWAALGLFVIVEVGRAAARRRET